ncbi:hypothetical protein [Desulfurobacterium sp.]|uniref:hypothetical protein n=1 Tax=Desulfurobacterium sp. TaxID=2004706 RepID=UPI00262ED99A|nr:hypothetical protein [Desulfurobacterium sp.]
MVEVFSTPESAYKIYKIIYLVLAEMNERCKKARLIGFAQLKQEEGLVFNGRRLMKYYVPFYPTRFIRYYSKSISLMGIKGYILHVRHPII